MRRHASTFDAGVVWKKNHGQLRLSELREMRQLRDENARLKRLVADLTLNKHILSEVLRRRVCSRHDVAAGHCDAYAGRRVGRRHSADHDLRLEVRSEKWTIPAQACFSKTVKMGRTPDKLDVEVNYYVSQAKAFGPKWTVGISVTPVVNNFIEDMLGNR